MSIRALPRAAFAAELPDRLDDEEDAEHARMAVGQAAAARVHGQPPARGNRAALDERAALPLLAEAEILEEQQRVNAERVVELEHVDLRGRQTGGFEGARAGAGRR